MRNELKGFEKIFAFTFRHHAGKQSFRAVTASVAILCILIPSLVMTGLEYFGGENVETAPGTDMQTEQMQGENSVDAEDMQTVDVSGLKRIFVVDISRGSHGLGEGRFAAEDFERIDYGKVFQATGVDLSGVKFVDGGKDLERAAAKTRGSDDALILAVNLQGTEYALNLLIPEDSHINEEIASEICPVFDLYIQMQTAQLNGPGTAGAEENKTSMDSVKDILGAVLPYINIMLIYFFVLLYGQGVSQSVVMEKSSKLMDVFLISVKPSAMVFGKMMAIGLAGILQMFIWIFSLIGGFALGYAGVKAINPETDMLMVQLMSDFGKMTDGMFSAGGFLLALLIILAGMLLYCALAGIGGALAGKQEDLASTNIFFTLILVISFFASIYGGGLGEKDPQQWLFWVPFTSIMVTPSAALLGTVSLAKAFGAFLIILVTALLFTFAAGRIYKNMALYKGDLPGIKQIVKMIK